MSDLLLKVDAGSRPGGGASEGEIHGPLRFIVRSAHVWGGNGVVPDFNKIRRVLVSKHPEVIAKAFGGDPNRAAAWMKDAWEKYHGRVLPGKSGAGPTFWRGKGKGGSTENDATMSQEATVNITLAKTASVPENPDEKDPMPCGDMKKGSHFKLPTYSGNLSLAKTQPGVYRHLGQHPTKRTHISAKRLSTGQLHAFPKTQMVVPVPMPRIISAGAASPSPFGGMGSMSLGELETELTASLEARIVQHEADLNLRNVPTGERVALAKKGQAIPVRDSNGEIVNGRYPIAHGGDLKAAVASIGRGKMASSAIKAHISKVAAKLKLTHMLPEGWGSSGG